MALIKCPECKQKVSNKAKTCPQCGAPVPGIANKQYGCGTLLLVLLIGVIVVSIISSISNPPEKPYSGKWTKDIHVASTQTLVSKGIDGCGYMKYKKRDSDTEEYLVGCSKDEKTWKYYLVWPSINKLNGPYKSEQDAVR